MQLISIFLTILSLTVLGGAIMFATTWLRARHAYHPTHILREGIGHIGISAIIEYPDSEQPLSALLDEGYPYCEVILITDLQRHHSTFGGLLQKFHLIRVNHSHLKEVRALYRAQHRSFRRVVFVDLPIEYRQSALSIGRKIASYDYLLHLQGESIIARDAITYCANIIASHRLSDDISLRGFLGEKLHLMRCDAPTNRQKPKIISNRILAWHRRSLYPTFAVLLLPATLLLVSHFAESLSLMPATLITLLAITLFIYISCYSVAERGLFATFNTVILNFYSFMADKIKPLCSKHRAREVFNRLKPHLITRSVSKIHDTPRGLSRVPAQNRPAHYRANSRREQ